jgi:hypothetical protein
MKKSIDVSQGKDKVLESMAKKLAVDSTEIFKKPPPVKKRYKIIYSIGIGCIIVLVTYILFCNKPNDPHIYTINDILVTQLKDNPLTRLKDDFNKNAITAEQYAFYLRDILIRYDSLPVKYRLDRPLIRSQDVYRALADIWLLLNLRARRQLTKELPQLDDRIRKIQDSLGIR